METVNVHAAKTNLSRLLDKAEAGEEIIIARSGNPVAKLGPLMAGRKKRRLGLLASRFKVPKDFDAPLPSDVLDSFEGR